MALPVMNCAMWCDDVDEIDLRPNPVRIGLEETTQVIAPQLPDAIAHAVGHVRQVLQ